MSRDATGPVDWAAIDTVMLDMDGTLLDLRFDNYFWQEWVPAQYAELHGLAFDAAMAQLLPRFRAAEGTLDWYCLDFWTRELGLEIAALKRAVAERIAVRPHVPEFLAALRAANKRVLLMTNAHHDALSIKMARTGLASHFDALVTSHDYGMAKEQVGFWDAVQLDHPFDPARTLFVDDSLSVLPVAAQYGLQVLTIRQPDSGLPPREIADFPAIDHFDELLPVK